MIIRIIFSVFASFVFYAGMLSATGEKVPFALIHRILPYDPIIVEAGAQFGEDTAWMSQTWAQGKIYAFEPVPESYFQLEMVAKNSSNIFTYPIALSDMIGEVQMYLAGGASSILKPSESFNRDYFHSDLDHPITVQCTTLDEWAKKNKIEKVDFLWLDMEGNELRALKGAPNILKTVTLIYTEVNLQKFWEGAVLYEELKLWLEGQGFVEIWKDIVPDWHGNVLFIRG
jgi:FkbM family methyltransferase